MEGACTLHAESLAAVLFGSGTARSARVWPALAAWRRRLLGLAIFAYAIYAGSLILWMTGAADAALAKAVMHSVYGLDQYGWTATILGYAHQYLARAEHPARAYLTQAIFPWYLVHQTLIIMAAVALRRFTLPIAVEAALILTATVGGCALFYELVRRIGWLRLLTGLKPHPAATARPIPRSPHGSCAPERPSGTAW